MTITKEQVLQALGNVEEPDLKKDLVTLNMIQDVHIDGNKVSFSVILTTPACPMKDHIKNACINAVRLLVNCFLHGLQELHGSRIVLPKAEVLRPNRDYLAERFGRFEAA